ncbi:deoxyribose-phosphate aldolase [Thermoflexus hugenholtzii]|mgnify:FL=1|jgi:deoxyribose-phosphate aldolase|uniref:Deoxyribose-phosphate aldolase n=1 Tax=Thermoflexus hugenholtzii JAD2 TaxID=877466 RepID=A0A212QW42_9CHLR|nr:deoxyribose-phosphate aldolase [Thermoflexus hugenholtzii]SNB63901.1 deoxyribose-phosphate aldolase [Thermoflexus hugenholtzii JAD2]
MWTREALAARIDHTLLRPEATPADIDRVCEEAVRYGCAAVCVNPIYVARAAERLAGTPVKVATVVGFPLGASLTAVRVAEASLALAQGAQELDIVLPIGLFRAGAIEAVRADLQAIIAVAHAAGAVCKVILETALLRPEEKIQAARLAVEAGADFVKTSTGFGPGGATVEDVALLRQAVGPTVGVKASGGIRTAEQAIALIEAGATRLGTSATVAILEALPLRAG